MRLGKIYLSTHYVVDLDDKRMIDEAKICLLEDLMNATKYNELPSWLKIGPEDSDLSEADIPEFLKGREEDEY